MIKNYEEFYKEVGVANQPALERMVYKGTDCGASCRQIEGGFLIGSIVEGVDGDGTEYHRLLFPFEIKDFWDTLQAVEDQAEEIWQEMEREMCEQ